MKVTKGFFWMQDNKVAYSTDPTTPAIVEEYSPDEVSNCIFTTQPKWYQIMQWYKLFMAWKNLA